jgi:tripartite-type tricarboxylate transporter receptor subunit TctC
VNLVLSEAGTDMARLGDIAIRVARMVSSRTPTDRYRLNAFAASVAVVATIASGPAIAENSDQATIDKTLKLIVGMPPGGGVDAYARLVQRHLTRFLPGSPSIIVQNKPGAGSLLSVMAVANSTLADGVVMSTFSSSLILEAIAEPERVKIDFRRFAFVGNVAEDYRVCYVRSESGIRSIEDLAARNEVVFGATAAGTSGNLDIALLKNFFNVKVKQVLGYPGSAAKRLAFERGEIDGDCGGVSSIPEQWLAERKINVVVRFLPRLVPDLDGDVPFAGALLSDNEDRKVYDFLVAPERLGRLFMVSDKVSKERIGELRRGFDAMVTDPGFLADAQKAALPVAATSGADVDSQVAELYAMPPEVLQKAKAINKQ